MALAIRLARQGAKKRPFYRIVTTEKSSSRDGRFVEQIGTYDPRQEQFNVKADRYEHWVSCGATPSKTVASLYKKSQRVVAEAPKES